MNRRSILLGLALLVVISVPTFTALAIGAWGRAQNVKAVRIGCRRQAVRNVALINVTRELADVTLASTSANHLVATDPTQSKRTRNARSVESSRQARAAMVLADAALILDGQTDASVNGPFVSTADARSVRYGIAGQPPFRCDVAYPITGLIP